VLTWQLFFIHYFANIKFQFLKKLQLLLDRVGNENFWRVILYTLLIIAIQIEHKKEYLRRTFDFFNSHLLCWVLFFFQCVILGITFRYLLLNNKSCRQAELLGRREKKFRNFYLKISKGCFGCLGLEQWKLIYHTI
jgi:hypothetical protein